MCERSRIKQRLPNTWFGIIGDVVEAHHGEGLTFIGDAGLATFPTSRRPDLTLACRDAPVATVELPLPSPSNVLDEPVRCVYAGVPVQDGDLHPRSPQRILAGLLS